MIERVTLIIDGIYEYFYSDTVSEYSDSIVSISPLTTTLDPLEPIVDSSPFTVELAADVDFSGAILRDLFSQDPISLGVVSRQYRSGDQYMWIRGAADADGTVCIGAGTYDIYYDHDDGSDHVYEVYDDYSWPCNLYVDQVMGIAPEVTRYPRVWKGRHVKLVIGGEIWRECYLTENPRITLSSVILTMAPIDARIRDHHPTPLLPTVARFAAKGRDYVSNPKTKHLCFWASGRSPTYTIGALNAATTYALVNGTIAYTGLYSTIQPTLSTPPGGALLPPQQTGHRIFTPCSPAIGKVSTSVGWWGITGRSSNTITFDAAITSDGAFSFNTLPALRVMVTDGAGSAAQQINNRFATASNGDPLLVLAIGSPVDAPTVLARASMRPSYNYGPPLSIGFIWTQNEQTSERIDVGRYGRSSFAWNMIGEWARSGTSAIRAAASCADSEDGLDALMLVCDTYSVKPINTPTAEVAISKTLLGNVRPVTDRAASYEVSPNAALTIAQATNYWVAGEPQLCLNQKFGDPGESVFVTVSWTEDGENFFERKFDLIYRDEPTTGVFRYDLGYSFKNHVLTQDIAGIGDWFGHRATFTLDPTLVGANEGSILYAYLTSMKLISSLMVSADLVDQQSFFDNSASIPLIKLWRFEDAKHFDDNIGAVLALSSTAISFSCGSGYEIRRAWIGPAAKHEAPISIDETMLLEIPTAELEDHILSDYSIEFADDKKVTYTDLVAKSLFNAEKTFELDLSQCSLNESMQPEKLAREMRGTLASLVNRFGAETMSYRLKVPFDDGKYFAPGDLISLTCSRVVGNATITPPSNSLCRVFDVEQDFFGQTTSLRVLAVGGGVAKYQRGARILGGFGTTTITVESTGWAAVGDTVYFGNNASATVTAKTSTTLTLSASPKYCNYIWAEYDGNRFNDTNDNLG